MAIKTRKEGRQALAALLTSEMVGTGKPLQAFYRYLIEDFEGESPVGCIGSSSILGVPNTFGGTLYPEFGYNILIFTTRTDAGSGDEEASEDQADDIAMALFNVISANRKKKGDWECLDYVEPGSQIVPWTSPGTGGKYWLEILPVRMAGFG
jgi:hypothetical protein